MSAQTDGQVDKTDHGAYARYGTKEFTKLFECMFNISYFKGYITLNDATNPVIHGHYFFSHTPLL